MKKYSGKEVIVCMLLFAFLTCYVTLVIAGLTLARQDPDLPLGTRLQNEAGKYYEVIFDHGIYQVKPLPMTFCRDIADKTKWVCKHTVVENKP